MTDRKVLSCTDLDNQISEAIRTKTFPHLSGFEYDIVIMDNEMPQCNWGIVFDDELTDMQINFVHEAIAELKSKYNLKLD